MADTGHPYEPPRSTEVPPTVAHLKQSLVDLIVESQALRTDVKTAEEARRRDTRVNLLLLGMLSIFVIMVLVVAYQNNAIAEQTRDTNAIMADCTTPGGKCHKQGSERTASAISSVLRTQIAALQCARLYPGITGPEYDRKLEACIYERVTALGTTPPTTPPVTPSPAPTG